ncbi:MAG: hypothetical protein A2504_12225 [Bdellovibrionales bacterium RIFOXYD12_FULL_39_22]|nr:MAG: hypothetical protein A2385_14075 [Bdellovibrionales bacterium RIFOXYB1_FULL_39_21]OFZ42529.1 MAG: hypothetical protein A2485_03585 [Bdellovibrionales bacterium RIFOXYC12_FULL_39_17]OFZ45807.1 MAG: hypothetical protein A2404_02300 [Bdellovibrionales bacterium RIFOXYC1_FULL_39_130]OFZ74741.1 MAG: hypothetical protein A2560_05230 [Bdellovibrionales bacterium RIFOXYD1_FULL_39_84]OFZ93120.1 MAG: hypothetical protein A2504_12225 [Bdellovibrionales bacterium RIFOXYD12_FULL_39_22]HLE12121.1 hy
MKLLTCIIVYFFPLLLCAGQNITEKNLFEEYRLNMAEVDELILNEQSIEHSDALSLLKLAKYYLINGDLAKAEYLLKKINPPSNSAGLVPIISNYLAITNFAKANFARSLEILEEDFAEGSKWWGRPAHYKEICLLKLINQLSIGRQQDFLKELPFCLSATRNFSTNQQFWARSLATVLNPNISDWQKTNSLAYIDSFSNEDSTKLWLKFALFTDNDKFIYQDLEKIPAQAYTSKRVRELLGLIHFRQGNNEIAAKFIDDIYLPNAENIKGEISLKKKEFEVAFGHFQLALKNNSSSLNALKKTIPLAFTLRQWPAGLELINTISPTHLKDEKKLTIQAAFLILNNEFAAAKEKIRLLEILFKDKIPARVNQLAAYLAFLDNDRSKFEMHSATACQKYEGVSCWLFLQSYSWHNLNKLAKINPDQLSSLNDSSGLTFDELKEEVPADPIPEEDIIPQDIVLGAINSETEVHYGETE